jgi:hypothetical protein
MKAGRWSVTSEGFILLFMVTGRWLLVAGHWSLVSGLWLLASGSWSLGV